MPHIQNYVSSELSHFVGQSRTQEEQYDLLVNKILKTGWLTHPPHDPLKPRGLSLDLSKPISTDELLKYQVVCFCDIPERDLAIHVAKYSRFGLAFKKDFLIEKGACPVFYAANENPVSATDLFCPGDYSQRIEAARAKGMADRALYFDTSVRATIDFFAALDALCCEEDGRYMKGLSIADCKARLKSLLGLSDAQVSSVESILRGNVQTIKTMKMLQDFLLNYVFSFIKCFDAKRSFLDETNYYMEREWRVAANVNFSLDDVARVFFPTAYAKRFRADLPLYSGQVSFID